MKVYPIFSRSNLKRLARARSANSKAIQGMTLMEMMVGIAVGSLVLGIIASASMTVALWFSALVNYADMDAKSRLALDQMSVKMRQAGPLTEFSPTRLKFALLGQTNSFVVYDWDSATSSLTEWKTGDSTTNTLLTGCDELAFSLYNSSFGATTNLSQSKALSVNWNCSRTVLGRKNTEEMRQAIIVIRNKQT